MGDKVFTGDDHGVDNITLLCRGEGLAKPGHNLGRDLCVILRRCHEGLDPDARRREPWGKVGRTETLAKLFLERLHVAAKVLLGERKQRHHIRPLKHGQKSYEPVNVALDAKVLRVCDRQGRRAVRSTEDPLEHIEHVFVCKGRLDNL